MDRQSLQWLHLQQRLDESPAPLAYLVVDVLELPFLYLLEQLVLVLRPERVIPLQHHVKQYPQRPHVRVNRNVVHFRHDLRRHVSRRPTKGINRFTFPTPQTESKINQFKFLVPVQQNVFGLDVSVDDVQLVQVQKSLRNDQNELFGLGLLHSVLRLRKQVIVQGVGAPVLKNEVNLSLGLDRFNHFGDGGVIELSQQVDFPFEVLDLVLLVESFLFVDFDGYLFASPFVEPHPNKPVCTFAEFSKNLVFSQLFFTLDWNVKVQDGFLLVDGGFFLLVLGLDLFLLDLVDVIGLELVFHHRIYELGVDAFGVFFLLFEGALSAFLVGRSPVGQPEQVVSRGGSLTSGLRQFAELGVLGVFSFNFFLMGSHLNAIFRHIARYIICPFQ